MCFWKGGGQLHGRRYIRGTETNRSTDRNLRESKGLLMQEIQCIFCVNTPAWGKCPNIDPGYGLDVSGSDKGVGNR